jgi:hypothetical protein
MIGIVGEYIGKILSELKARPIYFVAEHTEKQARTETARTETAKPETGKTETAEDAASAPSRTAAE